MKLIAKSIRKFLLESEYSSKHARLFSNIITVLVLINIVSVLPDIFTLYSKHGFFDSELNSHIKSPDSILINEISNVLLNIGIKYEYAFISIFLVYILSLISMLYNFGRLYFSILIVFLHTVLLNSGDFICYGADFMIGFLIYVNVFLSMENYMSKQNFNKVYSFTIRLLQVQLCVIYFFGGFGKAFGYDWYTGDAVWLSLNHYMNENILDFISRYTPKFIYTFLSLHILFVELLYPFLVCYKKTRKWVIIDILILHVGISLMIGLHTFSLTMIIFNLMAFYPERLVKLSKFLGNKTSNAFQPKMVIQE